MQWWQCEVLLQHRHQPSLASHSRETEEGYSVLIVSAKRYPQIGATDLTQGLLTGSRVESVMGIVAEVGRGADVNPVQRCGAVSATGPLVAGVGAGRGHV